MHDVKLVIVGTFGNREEAELAKGALASAGIDAMTQADTAGRMREHLAWSGAGFQVWVREEDADAAREILSSSQGGASGEDAGDSGPRPKWPRFT